MNSFLIDVNIILDVIFKRDAKSIALIERLIDENKELFITSSMVPAIDYFLSKYKVDKIKIREILFKKFKVITSTGKDAQDALLYKDSEDALIALSFKRICPDGIIITKDKNFNAFDLKVYTPEEFLTKLSEKDTNNSSIPLLDLKREYRHMLEDIDEAILTEIADARYILGPKVKEFEEKIAEYIGTKYAIGVASGTDALVLSLRALALKRKGEEFFSQNDLIITTPFTFAATAESILRAGATPLFVDIDKDTYNISPEKIKEAVKKYKKQIVGIIPVHLYGQSAELDPIIEIAKENNLFVVEDVAQAFGGSYKGKKLGSLSDAGCLSFFPSKNLGGFGDGGAITTDDEELYTYITMLRKHGGKDKYNVEYIGYNSRLDTIQAGALIEKLKYVDLFNQKRREIADIYNEELKEISYIKIPYTIDNVYNVYHQYTVRIKDRDIIQKRLKEKGIQTMVYYPIPLHKMKVFKNRAIIYDTLIESEKAANEVLSLPIEPLMSEGEVERVVAEITQERL